MFCCNTTSTLSIKLPDQELPFRYCHPDSHHYLNLNHHCYRSLTPLLMIYILRRSSYLAWVPTEFPSGKCNISYKCRYFLGRSDLRPSIYLKNIVICSFSFLSGILILHIPVSLSQLHATVSVSFSKLSSNRSGFTFFIFFPLAVTSFGTFAK